jgi:hypothetical protein
VPAARLWRRPWRSEDCCVDDFGTAQGRSTARDGLAEKLKGIKPAEIPAKCIETLRQAGAVVDAKAPGDAAALNTPSRVTGVELLVAEI